MYSFQKLQVELLKIQTHIFSKCCYNLENEEAHKKLKEEEKATIVKHLLACLKPEEDSVEVKARTVKVFKSISIHLKDEEIIQVFYSIVNYITDPKATGKDIYVNCIKSILGKVPGSFYETIGKIIIPTLLRDLILKLLFIL